MNIPGVYNISVDELAMPDTALCLDARGHGKTSGPRGYSPSLARSVQMSMNLSVLLPATAVLDWKRWLRTRKASAQ